MVKSIKKNAPKANATNIKIEIRQITKALPPEYIFPSASICFLIRSPWYLLVSNDIINVVRIVKTRPGILSKAGIKAVDIRAIITTILNRMVATAFL